MKYVILSFDDGLYDFYKNAFPILKKYGVNCTINVVKEAIMNESFDGYSAMSKIQIQQLIHAGFEIANHTGHHFSVTNFKDIIECSNYLRKEFMIEKSGLILPFSQKINSTLFSEIEKSDFIYCADVGNFSNKVSIKKKLFIFVSKIFKNSNLRYFCSYRNYSYKKGKARFLKRVPVYNDSSIENMIYLIKHLKRNECITFMFHSILSNEKEECPWNRGAWQKNKFDKFLKTLSMCKDVQIITQKEAILNE